jgi:hypothetical protein
MSFRVVARSTLTLLSFVYLLDGQATASPRFATDIAASLGYNGQEIVFDWEFLRPTSDQLTSIAATYNARPLGVPALESYPYAGMQTFLLILVDTSDPRRAQQIRNDILDVLQILGQARIHHQVVIATYADRIEPIAVSRAQPADFVAALSRAQPRVSTTRLGALLEEAIGICARAPAHRRAVYVFSDGHSDTALLPEATIAAANRYNIRLTFILSPSDRTKDIPVLERIVAGSGGAVVETAQRAPFLQRPFQLIDSGARVHFSLAGVRRYLWDRSSEVNVIVSSVGGRSEYSLAVPVPWASMRQTVGQVPGWFAVGALALSFSILGMMWSQRSKRKRVARSSPVAVADTRSDRHGDPPSAFLIDMGRGTPHPIRQFPFTIGRSKGNDLVIKHQTVSRTHAVLRIAESTDTVIKNKSTSNPMTINGVVVPEQVLAPGDVIGLGLVKLRFEVEPTHSQ